MSSSPSPSAGDEFSEAIEAQSFPWKIYDRWSHALAETFFSPSSSGAPVYLDLEDEALKEIAFKVHPDAAADPRGSLLQAVRRTLHKARPKDMFLPHVLRLRHWEKSDRVTPPPTIPLLAVLCLAAEDMRDGDGFAANNYYDRLMPLLDVGVERDKSNVIAGYRRDSFELWESLNFWLDDLGGARGLPTAFSLTHAHVGRPMSQALVRATDRDRFTELFSEAGFAPRSRIPPQELDPLLDEWISRNPSPVSHLLRAMWQRGDARERITEVACQVLENWTPTETLDTPAEAPSSARLRLAVAMRTFPRPALELNLVGVLPRGSGAPTLVSSEDQARQIPTEPAPGGWWTLAIPEEFEAKSLLEGQLSLLIPETGRSFDRRPRRLVPLVKDDLLNAFVEAERLQLGEDAILLCRVELDEIVGRALELIARPGFKRWHSDTRYRHDFTMHNDAQPSQTTWAFAITL